jgi:Rrf2 family protein
MKITALEEYGLRCMIQLAKNNAKPFLTLPDFKKREGLSIAYAGKLMMILKKAGLVQAARGRKGGYALTRPPEEISLTEIFDALGNRIFPTAYCEEHAGIHRICINHGDCRVRDIWRSVDDFFGRLFERITLADIASGNLDLLESISISERSDKSDLDKSAAITNN